MATVKFEYGKWNTIMGYQCGQCGCYFPFMQGAIAHEDKIDDNGGVCPDVEKEEEPDEV